MTGTVCSTSMENNKIELFNKQKELLDTFLSTGAISKQQYEKSLGDMKEKMDINEDDRIEQSRLTNEEIQALAERG